MGNLMRYLPNSSFKTLNSSHFRIFLKYKSPNVMWHPSGDPRNSNDKTVEQYFFKNADDDYGDNSDFSWRSKM